MTHSAISTVFEYINTHPGYRANMGVIVSQQAQQTVLCWGAVSDEDASYVPDLSYYRIRWPDAEWMPLSEQQAQWFDQAYDRRDHDASSRPKSGTSRSLM
ncbi:hypothetical protein [Saccharospirillum sp.]|uniref:hypothetical protein n=1 Tax=Saccharospirillum sp. TaxID=2033801 RepID=UPI00349FE972